MDGHEPERNRVAGAPPAPRTSLVGRDTAVAEVVAALDGSRLLTLTGPGGAGKTRLALAALDVVRRTAERPAQEVRWAELGGVHAAPLVAETVARTLGAPANAGSTPVDAIVDHLGQAEVVLALDNCEHVVDACAALADELLDACPGLRLLATSREPLGVAGETVWPVPALSLPDVAGATTDTVAASAAGQLFEQRARAIVPGFRLEPANAAAVARLCRRLDGLPLAIELAAARMRVLTVDQIVAGLDDACRLLVGGTRTAPARHQTLRAALDWSHDRTLGDAEGIAWSLISLGTVAQYQGQHDRADAQLTDAQALAQQASYPEGVAWASHELGLLALRRGPDSLARAEELLLDSLSRHRELGDRWRTASVLDDLAAAALLGGRPRRAAGLLGAAAAIRGDIGTVIAPCERADHDTVEGRARGLLGPDAFSAEWTRGRDSTIDDVLAAEDASRAALRKRPEPGPATTGVTEPPTATGRLRIRMLGGATVHLGDRQLHAADFGYGKPRELLWLLASTSQRTKEQIGLALWPDLAGGQLRNAFHTALRDLRRALGDPGWVVFNAGGYALDRSRDLWSDLHEFEASLGAARRARPAPDALAHLQRAIAAYGGDFLPELVDVDWADTRRGELRRVFGAALGAAGRLLATSGRYAEAAEVYRTATEHDPLEESAHRHLMSCLIKMGEPALAARLYQDLSTRLRDELGIAPSVETTAVYDRLARRR